MSSHSNIKSITAGLFLSFALTSAATAGDNISVSFDSGLGYSYLESNPFFYDHNGNRIFEFNFDSDILTFNGGIDIEFMNGWSVNVSGVTALDSENYTETFDWAGATSFGANDWTSGTRHPNTKLNHYYNISAHVAKSFEVDNNQTLDIEAGFKYIDTEWSVFGGDLFVNAGGGAQRTVGLFVTPAELINYQQKLPTVFIGAQSDIKYHNFTFGFGVRGGGAIKAKDEIDLPISNQSIKGEFDFIPFIDIHSDVAYKINDNFSLTAGANFQKYFRTRTNASVSPAGLAAIIDETGADLTAIDLSIGTRITF